MRICLISALTIAAASFLVSPLAFAQVDGCPQSVCVESETSIVYNPQTRHMDAFATATTDYNTTYWYDLCVDMAVGRLNGPYLVNATNILPSGYPLCSAASSIEKTGSVDATPGRQYYAVGLAKLQVYFEYTVWVPYPACGDYCNGNYYYDRYSYSQVVATQPSSPEWPSIVYTYPTVLVPVPVTYTQIAMAGSSDVAWSPPIITSVTPNPWTAGATTTVTISGQGFGYSPQLSISGPGIVSYTTACETVSSPECDHTIVSEVKLDANTAGGQTETITVTANGLTPTGWTNVPITGQSGQATAQATTQAFVLPAPEIRFNGVNVTANTSPSCPGDPRCVLIGQKIDLTYYIPGGLTPSRHHWIQPTGTIVGGYTASAQAAVRKAFPSSDACQHLDEPCLSYFWVTPSAPGTTWDVSYYYTYNGRDSVAATARFRVVGPTATGQDGAFLSASVRTPPVGTTPFQIVNVWPGSPGPSLLFGKDGINPGIYFDVTATAPAGAGTNAAFQFVQLITVSSWKHRTKGYISTGALPLGLDGQGGERWYPYPKTTNNIYQALDFPGIDLYLDNNDPIGESAVKFRATMYLMWDPALSSGCRPADKVGAAPPTPSTCAESIPVPLGRIDWGFDANAINTLNPNMPASSNGTGWTLQSCGGPLAPSYSAVSIHPTW